MPRRVVEAAAAAMVEERAEATATAGVVTGRGRRLINARFPRSGRLRSFGRFGAAVSRGLPRVALARWAAAGVVLLLLALSGCTQEPSDNYVPVVPPVPVSAADRYLAALPNAKLEVIRDCGHIVDLEQPMRLAELVIDFIAR